jgi:hypothetical protein
MRSSVAREHGRPLRWAKRYFWKFLAAVFSGAALSVASVGIEDDDGAVFAGDLDQFAGGEALVEQVEGRLRIVVGDPFADGLPGRFDGFERGKGSLLESRSWQRAWEWVEVAVMARKARVEYEGAVYQAPGSALESRISCLLGDGRRVEAE